MADRKLQNLWERLQNKKPDMPHFLEKVAMTEMGIRRILDFQVEFKYPVSVLAGGNGSGKSRVLVAANLAYVQPDISKDARPHASEERPPRGFSPLSAFPDSLPQSGEPEDEEGGFIAFFEHSTPDGKRSTSLRCPESSIEVMQEHGVVQRQGVEYEFPDGSPPERSVCFITPEHPINPSEIDREPYMLNEGAEIQKAPLSPLQMEFVQRLLPFRYVKAVELSRSDFNSNNKTSPLVVAQENGVIYADTHMAAGELTIFRLSQKMAQATDGLFLIDQVETNLHPSLQKSLMLELQDLALHNDLQIIVSTHSPAVLDSVPPIGRIFLERDQTGNILVGPAHVDLVQHALYGRQENKFNLLCEDKGAKSVLEGVFEAITSCLKAKGDSARIDISEGAGNFAHNARALRRFDQFQDFIFVLDGDQKVHNNNSEKTKWKSKKWEIIKALAGDKKYKDYETNEEKEKERDWVKYQERVMFIPGNGGPELWVWSQIQARPNDFVSDLGDALVDFVQEMDPLDALPDSAVGSTFQKKIKEISDKAKDLLHELSKVVPHTDHDICRIVSRLEAEREGSDIQPLVKQLKDAFQTWREGA